MPPMYQHGKEGPAVKGCRSQGAGAVECADLISPPVTDLYLARMALDAMQLPIRACTAIKTDMAFIVQALSVLDCKWFCA